MASTPSQLGDSSHLDPAAEEFLSWLAVERGRSPRTLESYRRDLRAFQSWLGDRHMDLLAATEADLVAYTAELAGSGRARSTVKRATVAIRSLYRFLADEGELDSDRMAGAETPSVPAALPKALTEAEVEMLLSSAVGEEPLARRNRALLELLYGVGLRISEAVGVDLGDLDLNRRLVRVLGKGSKERLVPLGVPATRAIEAWLAARLELLSDRSSRDSADALFLNARGGRLTRQGAWGILKKQASAVGLADKCSPHVLRHCCATHMLEHGADIRTVQELLGHASISSTQLYTLVTSTHMRSVYDSAHPRALRR